MIHDTRVCQIVDEITLYIHIIIPKICERNFCVNLLVTVYTQCIYCVYTKGEIKGEIKFEQAF